MKKILLSIVAALLLGIATVHAEAIPGKAAPAFVGTDANGQTHNLSDFAGKWVVLEWYNKDCPFVVKHYGSGNMQKLQETYTAKGVVWLSVVSSAPGKQGYTTGPEAIAQYEKTGSHATAVILDPTGTIGRAYGAKSTPHMFIINPQGTVVYAGAIDSNSSPKPEVIASSTNYVAAALDQGMAGQPIATPSTLQYGCSVKY